jgi:tRNA(fMet)-specific endonuclease VapC
MLLHDVSVVEYDADFAQEFGRVRVELRRQGIEVPSMDLLIASVALVHDLTIVTHNTADFRNIPGLRLDDWLTP